METGSYLDRIMILGEVEKRRESVFGFFLYSFCSGMAFDALVLLLGTVVVNFPSLSILAPSPLLYSPQTIPGKISRSFVSVRVNARSRKLVQAVIADRWNGVREGEGERVSCNEVGLYRYL